MTTDREQFTIAFDTYDGRPVSLAADDLPRFDLGRADDPAYVAGYDTGLLALNINPDPNEASAILWGYAESDQATVEWPYHHVGDHLGDHAAETGVYSDGFVDGFWVTILGQCLSAILKAGLLAARPEVD